MNSLKTYCVERNESTSAGPLTFALFAATPAETEVDGQHWFVKNFRSSNGFWLNDISVFVPSYETADDLILRALRERFPNAMVTNEYTHA